MTPVMPSTPEPGVPTVPADQQDLVNVLLAAAVQATSARDNTRRIIEAAGVVHCEAAATADRVG